MVDNRQHVKWFRESSPYIKAHRNKTFVIHLGGEAMGHENFHNIIDDILLLNSLGIRLVLAMGAKPQIDSAVTEAGQKSQTDNGNESKIKTTSGGASAINGGRCDDVSDNENESANEIESGEAVKAKSEIQGKGGVGVKGKGKGKGGGKVTVGPQRPLAAHHIAAYGEGGGKDKGKKGKGKGKKGEG